MHSGAMAEEGAVTVCVRMRPLIARENAAEDKVQLHWKSENCTVLQTEGTRTFSYDCVFHSNDSTQQVYEGVAVPIIKSAVKGYNGTIFAYGQTASGKTYTMMGSDKSVGIIPKAIQDIFKIICEIPDREFLLRVSYMEIYNEIITDLLCDSKKNKPLGIREDVNRNIYVEDLIEEVVVTPEQVMTWLRKGEKNRHYGETKMNERSSRSHTIFRMIIESRENDPANTNCDGAVMVSHLNLVDLAGSERASQTGSEGLRLKEGCNINRSLFILGQVIKKLCDDPSGFINYRDSKLTRILQNSLGGNAKTVIICTITPVSFDETLSTLQFASTAKRMKNTPKVNEVLDDEALLKRYRKEIVDLKRQLEEVSLKTRVHAMEKDQLAQLLEEKDSLQKVQENRIHNLTEMLVTSSSSASPKVLKAKRKRRVTWAPGKINQDNLSYFATFEKLKPTDAKKMKSSPSLETLAEDSMSLENSECDYICPPTPDAESEWNSGANLNVTQKDFADSVQLCETLALEKDIAVDEVNVLQANVDALVVENEQLKLEMSELKEKLKEKIETDEFEALEKQTQKDHEIQLMHEITNLQNIVKNAEVYNEELETELKSKLEQLTRKENEVKDLQKCVEELQKAGMGKKDVSFSMGDSDKLLDEIQQMSKSLIDTETVALDAKKESAFLRSENLELKEKMNELLNDYKLMEKDVQLYQSQLEAGKVSYKKMQTDLQRELQSAFQENIKLTSLLEGKTPKDFSSLVELERKTTNLKNELEKVLEENTALRKEVDTSSEFKSLHDKVEILQQQIFEKSEELHLLTSEREKLFSEVADKEARLQGMTEEIRKSKEDLASTQLKYEKAEKEYLELKHHHEELEQKWLAASEESEQMKHQVEYLNDEAQKLKTTVNNVRLELSSKIQELQEKTAEQEQLLGVKEELNQAQQRLSEMEQLKEKLKSNESRMEAEEMEKLAIAQKLQENQEEIRILIQERDDLKQKQETLQSETDQLKEDIQETITMNILAHEELRNAQSSLKQHQKTIEELEKNISEKRSEILNVQDTLGETVGELELKILQLTEELKQVTLQKDQLLEEKVNIKHQEESDQLPLLKEQILSLAQEKTALQQKLETLQTEKEQCEKCTSLIQQLQEKSAEQEQLLGLKEELRQAQKRLHEMEELKSNESMKEFPESAQKLHNCQETKIAQEREDLKTQETLQSERDQLRETIQETTRINEEMQEELRNAYSSLKHHQETIEELKRNISEKETQLSKVQEMLGKTIDDLNQKVTQLSENLTRVSCEHDKLLVEKERIEQTMNESICQQLQEISSVTQEKEEFQQILECVRAERDQLKADIQENKERVTKLSENLTRVSCEHDKLLVEKERIEQTMNERICQQLQEISSVTQEKEEFQQILECVRAERDQLKADIQENKERVTQLSENLTRVSCEHDKLLVEKERIEQTMNERICQQLQEISSVTQEKEEFQQILECVRAERDQLKADIQENKERVTQLSENLTRVSCEHDKLLVEKERIEQTMNERICQQLQEISSVTQEKEEFQQILECVRAERDQLKADIQENKDRSVKIQAEMADLQEELKRQKDQLNTQENVLVDREKELLKIEEKLTDETTQLKEKARCEVPGTRDSADQEVALVEVRQVVLGQLLFQITGTEEFAHTKVAQNPVTIRGLGTEGFAHREERRWHSLDVRRALAFYIERTELFRKSMQLFVAVVDQMKGSPVSTQRISLWITSCIKFRFEQTRVPLLGTIKAHSTRAQASFLAFLERVPLQGICKATAWLLMHAFTSQYAIIQQAREDVQQLTDTLNSVSHERHQLLAEKSNHYLQLQEQISSTNQEKDELQQILESVKSERDLLKTELQKNSDMVCACTETNAKLECALDELKQKNLNDVAVQASQPDDIELSHADSLKAKTLEVKELLEKFPMMEKKYECLTAFSLNLKSELNSQKDLIAVMLAGLALEQAKQVRRLQTENEKINNHLQSLLNKLKFLFSCVCRKKAHHYTTIYNHEMELLDERRKQGELLSQIQSLKQTCLQQDETASHELQQKLDFHIKYILRDVAEIESELLSIEAELQWEESARKKAMKFLETCSGNHSDVEKLQEGLKQDNERLLQVIKIWKPKVKTLLQISSELDTRTANYCKDSEIELKQKKGKTEELLEQFMTIKQQLAPCGVANLALEEENYRLHNQLKATDQDIKIMKTTIQKLQNKINEAEENVKEKEEKIAKLQAEKKMKAAASELTQLQFKLNETEKCLRNALTAKQTLKAKLDKGAELYKEEIDNLKTQLVKVNMERMKQSSIFEQEIANTKALEKHKEEQLRKLKEELRRTQQEQDVTVISGKDVPQASHVPLTCGGGSGIVQSTHMLILKSEQAKLQKENLQLKKQNDLLVSNEVQLKEELTKWKERALKIKAQFSRDTAREMIQRSPRKTASLSFKEQMPSPSKEPTSKEILPLDSPNALPLTCSNFFDNSNLGTLTDTQSAGPECTEDRFKQWLGSEKDKAPNCTTQ
ncbi:centromere-associated protein E [Emydura macquarii macquarii]|uniref:centromere-associated protein E n=1 Tax=Emydura macquarii macquarii TaxID=1129001 RepID=UPI00352BC73B